jgi:hypothetical protein
MNEQLPKLPKLQKLKEYKSEKPVIRDVTVDLKTLLISDLYMRDTLQTTPEAAPRYYTNNFFQRTLAYTLEQTRKGYAFKWRDEDKYNHKQVYLEDIPCSPMSPPMVFYEQRDIAGKLQNLEVELDEPNFLEIAIYADDYANPQYLCTIQDLISGDLNTDQSVWKLIKFSEIERRYSVMLTTPIMFHTAIRISVCNNSTFIAGNIKKMRVHIMYTK